MIDEKSDGNLFFRQTRLSLHRLRRYSHNRITESSGMMAGEMLNVGTRRTTYFVLSILLVSSLPMFTTVSADQGTPSELQAQDIAVSFDNVSETTTITWRNIEQSGGDIDRYEEVWDETNQVYRKQSPRTQEPHGTTKNHQQQTKTKQYNSKHKQKKTSKIHEKSACLIAQTWVSDTEISREQPNG